MSYYLWFDTEFTDLDPEKAQLLQVALIVTDEQLNRVRPVAEDVNLFIQLDANAEISPWVREHLADLIQTCRSDAALAVEDVDARLSAIVDEVAGPPAADIKDRPVLAGNSVHADMCMVSKFLPEFLKRLHYRLLDVSTLKLLWEDGYPGPEFDKDDAALVQKYFPRGEEKLEGQPHDALYDIKASIAELNFYRERLLVPPPQAD